MMINAIHVASLVTVVSAVFGSIVWTYIQTDTHTEMWMNALLLCLSSV